MKSGLNMPDKLFGVDSRILLVWLEPLGLALVLVLSTFLVIIPKIKESLTRMTQIKTVSVRINEVNQKSSYLQSMDQEEIKNNATKLALGLLPEKNAYLLVRVIGDAAAQTGYNIDDFSISMGEVKEAEMKKDNSGYDKIPVNLTLVGPSDNYLALVKIIERSLPIMSIENFEMRSLGEVASIKLSISAYYLQDISDIKLDVLTLADLTPSEDEADLLSTIGDYKTMSVRSSDSSGSFVKYERSDPFFTP